MPRLPTIIREMENTLGPRIREAYIIAEEVHRHEKRRSGEPYISHPIAVAKLLFDLNADADIISAALLHDVLEDNEHAADIGNRIYAELGDQVLYLVQAVSKDGKIPDKLEQQAAYLGQIQRAFEVDIFAFFIKIADLIHNMSTIGSLPAKRKQQWIKELREQYLPLFSGDFHRVPLAHRDLFLALLDLLEDRIHAYEKTSL